MISSVLKDKTVVEADSDFGVATKFNVGNMGMLFHALTSIIYNNPEYSVISEICANAWDSHLMAKNQETPFKIHLPNSFEPWFSVRDFGVSMSDDFMQGRMIDPDTGENVGYTTALYSTKNTSNKQNGSFGIGRLTCLALNDTYTAICYKDGIKRVYSIFKENSEPRILPLSTEPTDEPDGFEVSVNIAKKYNYNTFCRNAETILSFYPVCPKVTGNSDFHHQTIEYETRVNENGLNFGVLKNNSCSHIIMGVYSYPIDSNSLYEDLDKHQIKILDKGIHFFVKIGEVSVNLSRDGLFYDDKTKKKIKKSITDIQANYSTIIGKQISECPNYLTAKKLYWKYFHFNGDSYFLTGGSNTPIFWNSIEINDFALKVPAESKTKLSYCNFLGYKYGERKATEINEMKEGILINNGNFSLVVNDLQKKTGIKNRLNKYREVVGSYHHIYLIDNIDDVFKNTYKLADSDFISLSSLPTNYGTKVYNKERAKCKIFVYSGHEGYPRNQSNKWDVPEDFDETDIDELDETEDICYVKLEDRFFVTDKHFNGITNKFRLLQKVDSSISIPTIYGVRHTHPDIVEKMKLKVLSFEKWLDNKVTSVLSGKSKEILLHILEQQEFKKYESSSLDGFIARLSSADKSLELFSKLKKEFEKRIEVEQHSNLVELAEQFNFIPDRKSHPDLKSDISDMINSLRNMIIKKYPLLDQVSYYYNSNIEKWINYIHSQNERFNPICLDFFGKPGILGEGQMIFSFDSAEEVSSDSLKTELLNSLDTI